jgi:hypothetical protein
MELLVRMFVMTTYTVQLACTRFISFFFGEETTSICCHMPSGRWIRHPSHRILGAEGQGTKHPVEGFSSFFQVICHSESFWSFWSSTVSIELKRS